MLKIDLHLHTIASGHAQCTVYEYIKRAEELHMRMIGISDHSTCGPDTHTLVDSVYLSTLSRIPKIVNNIRILKGVEANIINVNGDLDVSKKLIIKKTLDYVLANFHMNRGYKSQGQVKNTQAMIRTIKSGLVNIISHPFVIDAFDIDIEKISQAACDNNVLLEVDLSYLDNYNLKKFPDSINNLKKMIAVVKKNKQKVIVNSDAHNIWEMGEDSGLKKIRKEIGLTNDMIINNYPKELMKILGLKD